MCTLAPTYRPQSHPIPPHHARSSIPLQNFYKTVLYPEHEWDLGGPNDANVTWAVFFHKPYCGACRRIRPVFHALGNKVNSSEHIRFASLDCVKYVG